MGCANLLLAQPIIYCKKTVQPCGWTVFIIFVSLCKALGEDITTPLHEHYGT